jgi:hypothetical protein
MTSNDAEADPADRIETFRFVLENLLEAVKRGESLQDSLKNYNYVGVLKNQSAAKFKDDVHNSPYQSNADSGWFVRSLWKAVKKVALKVMEIMTHAIKAVPKWVTLKPKPSIGLAGAFPTFSLEIELDAESITIHDLFLQLTGKDDQ